MQSALPRLLEPTELRDIQQDFEARIREGLAADEREIRALPAYAEPPTPGQQGQALVLDTGGTNMRAALVRFTASGKIEIEGPVETSLRARASEPLSRAEFFAMHATLAQELRPPPSLPVGYCFSYPSRALPDGDAELLGWTKGLAIEGVEGTPVGAGLREALDSAGLQPGSVSVLNDTVATLLGGASRAQALSARHIGLIVGTGTNMASFFSRASAPKLVGALQTLMAVNLESGNFQPPHLSALDDIVGAEAEPRDRQRFEKAVSGLYLPELYARARPYEAEWALREGARGLVSLARGVSDSGAEFARVLLLRSAQLVATGLAAVGAVHGGREEIHVLAEGSLFWSWPDYAVEVARVLRKLSPQVPFQLGRMEDANLVGAASLALTR